MSIEFLRQFRIGEYAIFDLTLAFFGVYLLLPLLSKIMSAKILFWVFVFFGAGFEIVGDIFFKKWTVENRPLLMWAGFFIYSIGTLFWAFSLKYETLSKTISIFTILNLVIVVLIGIIFFKENISVVSKIGIVLGIISIVLIERG